MRHIVYANNDVYRLAILVKQTAMNKTELTDYVVQPLVDRGLEEDELIVFSLSYNERDKAPIAFMRSYLQALLPELGTLQCRTLLVMDASYFKTLTKTTKADEHLGYVLPCVIDGFEHLQIVYAPNHKSVMYNPALLSKLGFALDTAIKSVTTGGTDFGQSILKNVQYPSTLGEISAALDTLLTCEHLACDIETAGLTLDKAGIATIAFSTNPTDGVAFAVDYQPIADPVDQHYGCMIVNEKVRHLLRQFFSSYTGTLTFHNAPFDIKILIYELFMSDPLDTEGLLHGLSTVCRNFHDTRIIAYLALNSTAMPKGYLGLKELSQPYAGHYGIDVKNVLKVPLDQLLEYNVVDTCCTFWVYEHYYNTLYTDDQAELYFNLMLPSLKTIIQMELTGMPLNPQQVKQARAELEQIRQAQLAIIHASTTVTDAVALITRYNWEKDYTDRRNKAKKPENIVKKDFDTFPVKPFNPNSGRQLQALFYDIMQLPVLDKTKTGQPAVGKDTIDKLIHHCQTESHKTLLSALISYNQAEKILSTFIVAFEKAIDKGDGMAWLHGSFLLGGAKSGRCSSASPNLQNLPSGSVYGKLIKQCFQAPDGWLWAGADFNSLEDYVSALTTRDPNKLKVYENGYDGHSLRAYAYFPDECPEVQTKMALADKPGKFYKRTQSDGHVEYLHESEL